MRQKEERRLPHLKGKGGKKTTGGGGEKNGERLNKLPFETPILESNTRKGQGNFNAERRGNVLGERVEEKGKRLSWAISASKNDLRTWTLKQTSM